MRNLWPVLLMSLTLAVSLGACGGDDESSQSGEASTSAATDAGKGAADPRAAIQAYFTAQRLGQAEKICALESEALQTLKYDTAGQPCLDDEANNQPQTVWANPIKIVSLDESGDKATATLEPNAGTPDRAQITLSKADGAWIVDALH